MKDYFQSPVNNSWVNFAGHPNGDAMDLGWRTGLKNFNQDIFAMADGVVVWAGWLDDGGNAVVIKHDYKDGKDAWVGLMHFKNPAIVKVGDRVKRGQKVGNMGNTGTSAGEHVHVRISLVPKGSSFNWDLFNNTRVNPFNYVYEFSHQEVLDMKKKPSTPFQEEKSLSFDVVVQGVIDGKYGNGKAREEAVAKTGHDYSKVQEKVNERLGGAKPKPQPSKPSFKPYKYSLPNGSTLYNASGGAYTDPTTKEHTVTILKENNGLGLIRESWLRGVNEAWVKLGAKPKPVFKPYNKTLKTGSKLYDSNGNAYTKPTTNTHNVKVLQEKNGLGLIRESWLIGVSEAWIKL